MAADGNWNLTMSTPMGERNATLNLTSSGGTLTGTQGAEGNSTEIFEARWRATTSPGRSPSPIRCR